MQHILIVDDDKRICTLLARLLRRYNFNASIVFDTESANKSAKYFIFDAIITDVKMEKKSGIEFTNEIRKNLTNFDPNIPIIMISAGLETQQRLEGLKNGADDYLVKPFEPDELVLRLEGLLRRSNSSIKQISQPKEEIIKTGSYTLNIGNNNLFHNENKVALSPIETSVMSLLMNNPNIPFSRESLIIRFLPEQKENLQSRAVDVMIARLRRKIETLSSEIPLITKRGEGYLWRI